MRKSAMEMLSKTKKSQEDTEKDEEKKEKKRRRSGGEAIECWEKRERLCTGWRSKNSKKQGKKGRPRDLKMNSPCYKYTHEMSKWNCFSNKCIHSSNSRISNNKNLKCCSIKWCKFWPIRYGHFIRAWRNYTHVKMHYYYLSFVYYLIFVHKTTF